MNALLFVLLAAAFIAIDLLRGGTRLIFALPAYGLIATAAVLSFFPARRPETPRGTRVCLIVGALFFGYLLARTVLSPAEYLARTNLYALGAALLLYLVTAARLLEARWRMGLVVVLLVLGMGNAVIGAIQFFGGENYLPFAMLLGRADYGWRASGLYNCPNHLAGLLELVVLMGLSLTWWSRWPAWGKILGGYGVLLCLGGLLLTGSRGGYVSTLAGLAVFAGLSLFVMARRGVEHRALLIGALAVFAAVLGFAVLKVVGQSASIADRVASMEMKEKDVRLFLGKAALQQFFLSPVAGTGSGTYLYYGREFRVAAVQRDPVFVHNDYLQLLAEYGAAGLVALLIFLKVHAQRGFDYVSAWRAHRLAPGEMDSDSLALCIGALSCLVACAVHAVVDFNMHIPANALVAAFLLGLLANPGADPGEEPSAAGRATASVLRFVVPVLGLALAAITLPKIPAEFWAEKARILRGRARYLEAPDAARAVAADAQRALASDPRHQDAHYYLGEALVAQAEWAEDPAERARLFAASLAPFERALALAPRDRDLVLCLAWSLDALQRFEESEAQFRRALELDPKGAEVRFAHAAHLELRGQLAEAEAAYRAAYQLGSAPAKLGIERLAPEKK